MGADPRSGTQQAERAKADAVFCSARVDSTRAATFKHDSIARDERVNLCILSGREPFDFVAVEGFCSIERNDLVPATKLVFAAISDTPYQEPEDLEGWLEQEGRVILRIRPLRTYGVIRGLADEA